MPEHSASPKRVYVPLPLAPSLLPCLDRWLMALERIEAVPIDEAAYKLGVHKTTVHRMVRLGELEAILRRGKRWITVRSILHLTTNSYGPTANFNALAEFVKSCSVCGKCSNASPTQV